MENTTGCQNCIVCGNEDDGKPLYKKLGSGVHGIDVFCALKKMKLITIQESEKAFHYICWECDDALAIEYTRFSKQEEMQKTEEIKREKRDAATKKKMQIRLRKAFKRAKAESGPKKSIYKSKGQIKRENNYHINHCFLCDGSFENHSGNFQRCTLLKMVDANHNVSQVLEVLGMARHINPMIQNKRFICLKCFNVVRRTFKDKVAGVEKENEKIKEKRPGKISYRRPTIEEHAAEIAKLVPPALADTYKIVTNDTSDCKKIENEEKNDSKKIMSPSLSESSSSASDSDSSSDTSTDASPKKKKDIVLSKGIESAINSKISETESVNIDKNGNSIVNDSSSNEKVFQNSVHSDIVIGKGICNICGFAFESKSINWWYSLNSKIPKFTGITVQTALQLLETNLAKVSDDAEQKKLVCHPCYTRISSGFTAQVMQRLASQKGIDPSKVDLSKVKVTKMQNCGTTIESVSSPIVKKKDYKKMPKSPFSKVPIVKPNKNKHALVHIPQNSDHIKAEIPPSDDVSKSALDEKSVYKSADANVILSSAVNESNLSLTPEKESVNRKCTKSLIKTTVDEKLQGISSEHSQMMSILKLTDIGSFLPKSVKNSFDREQVLEMMKKLKLPDEKSTENCAICKADLYPWSVCYQTDLPTKPPNILVSLRWALLTLNMKIANANSVNKLCSKCFSDVSKKFKDFVWRKVAESHNTTKAHIDLNLYQVEFDEKSMNIIAEPLPEGKRLQHDSLTKNVFSQIVNDKAVENFSNSSLESIVSSKKVKQNSHLDCVGDGSNVDVTTITPSKKVKLSSSLENADDDSNVDDTTKTSSKKVKSRISFGSSKDSQTNDFVNNICTTFTKCTNNDEEKVSDISSAKSFVSSPKKDYSTEFSDKCEILSPLTRKRKPMKRKKWVQTTAYKKLKPNKYKTLTEECGTHTPKKRIELTSTFNHEEVESLNSQNIESYIRIWETFGRLDIDKIITEKNRQPINQQEFTIGFLLFLNDIRIYLGASLSDLCSWICCIMPEEHYNQGLRACETNILTFLIKYGEKNIGFDLRDLVQTDIYINDSSMEISKCCGKNVNRPTSEVKILRDHLSNKNQQRESSHEERELSSQTEGNKCVKGKVRETKENEINGWEDFLGPVDLDVLLNSDVVCPVTEREFSNGLLYALWKICNMMNFKSTVLHNWLRRLSPVQLTDRQLNNLVEAVPPIHLHIQKIPENIKKLCISIIRRSSNTDKKESESSNISDEESNGSSEVYSKPSESQSISSVSNKQKVSESNLCDTMDESCDTYADTLLEKVVKDECIDISYKNVDSDVNNLLGVAFTRIKNNPSVCSKNLLNKNDDSSDVTKETYNNADSISDFSSDANSKGELEPPKHCLLPSGTSPVSVCNDLLVAHSNSSALLPVVSPCVNFINFPERLTNYSNHVIIDQNSVDINSQNTFVVRTPSSVNACSFSSNQDILSYLNKRTEASLLNRAMEINGLPGSNNLPNLNVTNTNPGAALSSITGASTLTVLSDSRSYSNCSSNTIASVPPIILPLDFLANGNQFLLLRTFPNVKTNELVSKVQELERQLNEIKEQNTKLLNMNKKLILENDEVLGEKKN